VAEGEEDPIRRVLVAGSTRLVADALAVMLDGLPGVTAQATDPARTGDVIGPDSVDTVVVTVGGDVDRGVAFAGAMSAAHPGAQVVFVVPPPVRLWERVAGRQGWRVVCLDQERDALVDAVGAVGGPRRARLAPAGSTDRASLSPREIEVLRSLAGGLRPEEISDAMGVSPHTVRSHIRNLISKLGVRSRLEAVAEGRRAGYLVVGRPMAPGPPVEGTR